jgi:DNA polymerase III delta prime subunit
MSGTQLKTGISRVRWCDPDDGRYTISSAVMPGVMTGDEGDDEKDGMSWFDEMFRGGIELPKEGEKQRAVTLLITGPPGTGKSTLAMELCVRLATRPGIQQLGGKTLYVASEAHPPWMIGNAKSFGWVMGESKIPLFSMGPGPSRSPISICTLSDVQTGIGDFFANMRHLMSLDGSVGMRGTPNTENLELVVIDSLNSVETDKAKKFEEFYQKFVEGGPRLIVFSIHPRLVQWRRPGSSPPTLW